MGIEETIMTTAFFKTGHPPDDALEQYMLGTLYDDWKRAMIEAHFRTGCPRCEHECETKSNFLIDVLQYGQCQRA